MDLIRYVFVDIIKKSNTGHNQEAPLILLIAPPQTVELPISPEVFADSTEKSSGFSKHYRRVANEKDCLFLNAGEHIESSPLDGIHFEAEMHEKLGLAIAAKVKNILG